MKSVNVRSLTVRYTLALSLVGLCTLASHLILPHVLYDRDGSAFLINTSGRQRMLSQRISSLAAQRALGDATVDVDLRKAVDLFEANFRILSGDTRQLSLDAIYDGQGLSSEVSTYIAEARQALAIDRHDPALRAQVKKLFELSRNSLIQKLDAVVSIHQHDSEQNLARLGRLQNASLIVVFVTLLAEAVAIFRPMVNTVTRYTAELLRLSQTDELTQLADRRAFFEAADIELNRTRRSNRQVSILMVDVDNFKRVNDTYGHANGDAVLRAVSAHIRQIIRPFDTLARIGGEEFAVLIPEADQDAAFGLAERIRASVADLAINISSTQIHVTVSIGVASLRNDIADAGSLVAAADAALYVAKAEGRNRVVIASHQPNSREDRIFPLSAKLSHGTN